MKMPKQYDGLCDDLDRFHQQLRAQAALLPPTAASELLTSLLATVPPLLEDLKRGLPTLMQATDRQRAELESQLETAKQNVAQARANLANVPPPDQIAKNLVPPATPLPAGVAVRYADEMRNRYLPARAADPLPDREGAAWQDWSLS